MGSLFGIMTSGATNFMHAHEHSEAFTDEHVCW